MTPVDIEMLRRRSQAMMLGHLYEGLSAEELAWGRRRIAELMADNADTCSPFLLDQEPRIEEAATRPIPRLTTLESPTAAAISLHRAHREAFARVNDWYDAAAAGSPDVSHAFQAALDALNVLSITLKQHYRETVRVRAYRQLGQVHLLEPPSSAPVAPTPLQSGLPSAGSGRCQDVEAGR